MDMMSIDGEVGRSRCKPIQYCAAALISNAETSVEQAIGGYVNLSIL